MKIWRVIPLAIKTWPQWKLRSDLRQHLEKKRTTLQRLSLHSSHGAQVWKLGSRGSVQWLFTFFLIVPASPSSQSIHYLSGYCSSPPSWWWGLTKKKKRRKRLLKTGAVEQSLETPPRLDPPVQEHDLLLGFYEACSVNTNSLALFFFLSMRCLYLSVLMSTNMLWQPEAKQFPMKKNLIRNIHFAVGLRDSSSEATRRDQIKPLQGESWDKHMYCAPLMYCSLLRRLIFLHFKSSHHYILPAALKYYIMSLTLMAVFDPDLICNAIPASLIKSEPFAL